MLYPHNQSAYNAAKKMLQNDDRACIIHPTGTGKSLIIAEFINNNPDAKHLLLAPGAHIKAQIEKHTSHSFVFSTYQYLIFNVEALTGFDFIYADEFHRIGADVWGSGFQKLLKNNPGAKLLGTSATNIRFLDDNRDMAVEVFQGKIASNISLREAILDGILKAPSYVVGLYDPEKYFKRVINKVKRFPSKKSENLLKQIKSAQIDWNESKGVAGILKKHLSPERKKIIVFCSNVRQIENVRSVIHPVLKSIFKEPVTSLTIHSYLSDAENEMAMSSFNHLKTPAVLFSVDMINEGLHVEGCSTVILIRETTSPILYYQQIGRAFMINQTQVPLIIDLVHNLNRIKDRVPILTDLSKIAGGGKSGAGEHDMAKYAISIYDETKGLQEIIDRFSNQIEYFDVMYDRAEAFYVKYKDLRTAFKHDKELNSWLIYIRKLKKANNISTENIAKMDAIGMEWEIKKKPEQYVDEIEMFIEEGNELPKNRAENTRIYDIVHRLKKVYRENKLDEDTIQRASQFFNLSETLEDIWMSSYEKAKLIFEKKGFVSIPKTGHELSVWSQSNKVSKRVGSMTVDREKLLSKINFVYNYNDFAFERNVDELASFFQKNKRYPSVSEKPKISRFLSKMKNDKTLSNEKIKILNKKLPGWALKEDVVQEAIERNSQFIQLHFKQHGSLRRKNGSKLSMAINYIRNIHRQGKLPYDIEESLSIIPGLLKK